MSGCLQSESSPLAGTIDSVLQWTRMGNRASRERSLHELHAQNSCDTKRVPGIFCSTRECVPCVTLQLDATLDTRDLERRSGRRLPDKGWQRGAYVSRRLRAFLVRVDLIEANEPGAVLVPEREAQRRH